MKKRNQTLSEISSNLFEGRFESLPPTVTIDLRNVTKADFNTILELARYKAYGAPLVKGEDALSTLQKLKEKNNQGRFSEVLDHVDSNSEINSDVILEKARALVFSGAYEETLKCLQNLIVSSETTTLNRGVASQLAGHALVELDRLPEAAECFHVAMECAKRTGNALGQIAVLFFNSRIQSFENDFNAAEESLREALRILKSGFGGMRWYLGLYRHLSHLFFLAGNPVCLEYAKMAVWLAGSLGDNLFRARGMIEFLLMANRCGDLDDSERKRLRAEISKMEKRHSEVLLWAQTLEGRCPVNAPLTLRKFLEASRKRVQGAKTSFTSASTPWCLDRRNGLFADFKDGNVIALPSEGRLMRLVVDLAASEREVPISEFFERNWGVSWVEERHKSLLSVTLVRLNRISPGLRVERSNKSVRLIRRGHVI